jgi:hypothetical protein
MLTYRIFIINVLDSRGNGNNFRTEYYDFPNSIFLQHDIDVGLLLCNGSLKIEELCFSETLVSECLLVHMELQARIQKITTVSRIVSSPNLIMNNISNLINLIYHPYSHILSLK